MSFLINIGISSLIIYSKMIRALLNCITHVSRQKLNFPFLYVTLEHIT